MTATITIPDEIPAMMLPGSVLLPQTALPLRIFETRYREMLADVLADNRMFAIANRKQAEPYSAEAGKPRLHPVAGIGIVRMSAQNKDGTSFVMLVGAARVRVRELLATSPYPTIRIEPMPSIGLPIGEERRRCVGLIMSRIDRIHELIFPQTLDAEGVCREIEDPEPLLHFVMQNYCNDADLKQRILETTDFVRRIDLALRFLDRQIAELQASRS